MAERALESAGLSAGQRVLDVACGTGILARAALAHGLSVTGVDLDPGMIEVARSLAPGAEFFEGPAESLPFEDDSFDAAIMQFGLMLVPDRLRALAEMGRVVVTGGSVVVLVWAPIETNPGYLPLALLFDELAGAEQAAMFRAPYTFGEEEELRSMFEQAGLRDVAVRTVEGTARYDSVGSLLRGEIDGSPLAGHVSSDDPHLVERATSALSEFIHPDGRLEFPNPAVIARPPPDTQPSRGRRRDLA